MLVEKKAASIEVRDRAEAQLEADDAGLQLARARLDKTRILAPFDGVIGLRTVSVGDFVDVGQVLVNLVDIDVLKVDFRVGEVYLPDVVAGQDISLRVDAFPTQTFTGAVYAIEPEVDINGRAVVIRAQPAESGGQAAARPVFARHVDRRSATLRPCWCRKTRSFLRANDTSSTASRRPRRVDRSADRQAQRHARRSAQRRQRRTT